ncbi:hypothetical protein DM02DRAFT_615068 [Periconia macrospinosa]|uniref:RNA polymerase III RPC4-domain-containing protein n=1 Tax=Periconia macrospinosa TaxID=97972 RepID=A0A2V1DMZ0_9PLEO|nr:hypothetical protein DM02DRAFT_615068 [Periconia macrospinosa]
MPPKGRGRGGTRGRGTARGGAAASNRSNADAPAPDSTLETSANAGVTQSSEAATVSQTDAGAGASVNADTNITPTIEPHNTSSVSASPSTTAQTVAGASSKAPRQRLDSLKSAESASRSASPSVRRGTSSKGKKPVALPTFSGRRSKEDREARDAASKQREMERNKERDKLAERKRIAKERDAKRMADRASRGRGGYSGAVSGPFSMQSARQDKRSAHRNFGGSGSGSRATRVKDENDSYQGSSSRSGGPSGGGSSVKREDGHEVSSDDDAEFPRKDIDKIIELSSDEDEPAPSTRLRAHLPVRIGRKEHQERVVGINTDASTETSAKLLQEANQAGNAPATSGENTAPKGKGKANDSDLEVTGERKRDDGEQQNLETETNIKSESMSDEAMEDAEQVGIATEVPTAERKVDVPTTEKKSKKKEPNLQTDEERAEWARFQANLSAVRAELGPEDKPHVDASGDTDMADAAAKVKKESNPRDEHVYLFQLPPIIPELKGPTVKKDPSGADSKTSEPSQATNGEAVPIKKEEEFSNPLANIPKGPTFASGCVGKLRVHQSGRTTLDWGGINFELAPGKPVSFLQEAVAINILPEKERVTPEDAGSAVSLGRIKGKFVVTPDFSSMME